MIKLRSIGSVIVSLLAVLALILVASVTRAQSDTHEDLAACPGSAPEPGQSAAWSVAFCNRTGHDIVIEFHDNDCPAKDWGRRGDVYQRTLRRGESKTLPLCFANEPAGKKPVPGVPTLRIAGGKGVTTTWNVVGDCGDRSKPLNLDARTFYDRGDYKTGIILLQYPSGASHCASDSSGAASVTPPAPTASPPAAATQSVAPAAQAVPHSAAATQPQPPVATHSPIAAPPAVAAAPAAAAVAAVPAIPRTSGSPTLTAEVDSREAIHHTVHVYAKGGAGYRCNFNLGLKFSDGGEWNDKVKADLTGSEDVPISTRKYLKTVTKVEITSSKCAPM
jgi:hypothetical protein